MIFSRRHKNCMTDRKKWKTVSRTVGDVNIVFLHPRMSSNILSNRSYYAIKCKGFVQQYVTVSGVIAGGGSFAL